MDFMCGCVEMAIKRYKIISSIEARVGENWVLDCFLIYFCCNVDMEDTGGVLSCDVCGKEVSYIEVRETLAFKNLNKIYDSCVRVYSYL